ncbi:MULTISPECIES: peptidoglycan-binding protein [Mumia]|uniref:peptidoglycan-binding protein n=1 Tax=Mumia TaxID=1546255 RepID=UPI00141DABBA|nr:MULTISPECIES: peptidoglycan-binding protein [unclassified Mumia]QMW65009.1 peptidoglycan-binding protein [Mumia sp. ZJ1417]
MRRLARVAVAAGAGLGIAGATAAAVGYGGADPEPESAQPSTPATAEVVRTTLSATQSLAGTLGYGTATTVSARGSGTLTWLRGTGRTVERGERLFEVDARPVVLLYGTVPAYRPLSDGVEGEDVEQLERNLAALGYSGFTVDEEFTEATADAVERWQEDLGIDETGRVEPGDVVVAAGAVRVASHSLAVGDLATGPVLTTTSRRRSVAVDLDAADQDEVRERDAVSVTLPDGTTVAGRVSDVGTVATAEQDPQGGEETTTVPVTVRIGKHKALGRLDAAPVEVTIVTEEREDVLAAPVNALVALAEGGYGLEVVADDGTTSYVAVEVGLFADGQVEVSGEGLAEGTNVVVPS